MTTEVLSYTLIVTGLFILGFNTSIFRQADKIVRQASAWRAFIAGKSLMTVYVIIDLHNHAHDPRVWSVLLAGVAIVLTLVSLFFLDRSYRHGHPV